MANELLIEGDFRDFLIADTDVLAALGTRIVPAQEAQKQPRPYCRYARISTDPVRSLRSNTGLRKVGLQLDVFADRYSQAKAAAHAIGARADHYRGTVGGKTAQCVKVADEVDEFESPEEGEEKGVYRVRLDIYIWYDEG